MSATRPTGYPAWASGVSGYITAPSAGLMAIGWQPDAGVAGAPTDANTIATAAYMNWLHNLTNGWIEHLDAGYGVGFLGDGSDGSLTIVAPTRYQLSRHTMLQNLTVTGVSAELATNGFIPFVRGKFDGRSGVISNNGSAGTAGFNSAGLGGLGCTGPLSGGMGAGTGLAGPTLVGEMVVNALGAAGGSGGGTFGGGGGSAVSPSGLWRYAPPATDGLVRWSVTGAGQTMAYLRGGAGGGVGGGLLTTIGGGGGAGGGVLLLPCMEADFKGTFQARGGDGGGATALLSWGGGGGGGGAVIVTYGRKTNLSYTTDCRGGLGGFLGQGGSGFGGNTGATGVIEIQMSR